MSQYRHYPSYKDSGVEWLRQVPEHWKISPVKSAYSLRNGFPFSSELFTPNESDSNRLIRIRDILGNENQIFTEEECPDSAKVKDGDVLIGMDGDFNVVQWVSGTAKLNQRVCAVNGENALWSRFFYYCIPAPLQIINDLTFSTTVKHLSSNQVLSLRLPVPPAVEVAKIVSFLDRETARIDALIEKKQRQIELLKEKRQAIITQAVTKGLDPDVPMKDSGVEWLGEVPEHWGIYQIRHLVRTLGGGTPAKDNLSYWDGDIPWVSPKDMKTDYLSDAQDKISDIAVIESSAKLIPVGSVLIVVRGMILLHSAPVALTEVETTVNQDMKALISNKEIDSEYLLFLLKGLKDRVLTLVDKSAHGTCVLPTEDFLRLSIAVPDLSEQQVLVDTIKKSTNSIDSLIAKSSHSIDLLQERRSALITAAVTGQIDVREEV